MKWLYESFCEVPVGLPPLRSRVTIATRGRPFRLRPQIDVTGYVIHVDLDPATGKLSATAAVTFTALEDLDAAVFGLNNALQVESIQRWCGCEPDYVRDVPTRL